MGPEHASREKILSLVIFLFSWTKMYIELDSKRSKPGVERDLRKTIFLLSLAMRKHDCIEFGLFTARMGDFIVK